VEGVVTIPNDGINEEALTAAHKTVEDVLIDLRDGRIGAPFCANGFVARERDGSPSGIIRLGTRDGLAIGIKAYLDAIGEPCADVRPAEVPDGVRS
jgi:hypothetical protein